MDGDSVFVYTSPGNLVVTGGPNEIELILVGGGGGGGTSPVSGSSGGGGGGGGAVFYRPITVSAGTHPVVVGVLANGNPVAPNNAGPNGQGGSGGGSGARGSGDTITMVYHIPLPWVRGGGGGSAPSPSG